MIQCEALKNTKEQQEQRHMRSRNKREEQHITRAHEHLTDEKLRDKRKKINTVHTVVLVLSEVHGVDQQDHLCDRTVDPPVFR